MSEEERRELMALRNQVLSMLGRLNQILGLPQTQPLSRKERRTQ